MNNILITTPAKDTRRLAREFLTGYWEKAILAYVLFYAILEIPVLLYELLLYNEPAMTSEYLDIANQVSVSVSFGSTLYEFVITGVFALGLVIFFLSLVRNQGPQTLDALKGFDYFFKALGLFFMVSLFTVLWSLLLIIPGIIAAFRYSQAFYILADNPEKGIMDCISESKEMMKGNKMKLFCLNLSFIGWFILAALPSGIFAGIIEATATYQSIAVQLINVLLSAVTLAPMAYMNAADAVFYEMLKGKNYEAVEVDYDVVY